MPGVGVPVLGRCGPEITDDERANRCRQRGCAPALVDRSTELVPAHTLAVADFVQGVPHVGFEPEAGTPPADGDVAIDERAGTAACRGAQRMTATISCYIGTMCRP